MKLRITMKTPDCVEKAIDFDSSVGTDEYKNRLIELCSKWFRYGEICTLEVDTEKETISVIPAYTTTK